MNKTKKLEPLKVNCFRCQQSFFIKFVIFTGNYSRKNNWEYWTENKENKDKRICNSCLLDMYHNHKQEYLSKVNDERKRNLLRNYISDKVIENRRDG